MRQQSNCASVNDDEEVARFVCYDSHDSTRVLP